jgi:hypothetical protein
LEIQEAKVQQNSTHRHIMLSANEDKSNSNGGINKENGEHKRGEDVVEFVDEGLNPSSLQHGSSFDEALLVQAESTIPQIKERDNVENTTNPTSERSTANPSHGFGKVLPKWQGDAHRFTSSTLSRLVRDTTMVSAATGQKCKVPRTFSIEEILSRALEIINNIDVSSTKTN